VETTHWQTKIKVNELLHFAYSAPDIMETCCEAVLVFLASDIDQTVNHHLKRDDVSRLTESCRDNMGVIRMEMDCYMQGINIQHAGGFCISDMVLRDLADMLLARHSLVHPFDCPPVTLSTSDIEKWRLAVDEFMREFAALSDSPSENDLPQPRDVTDLSDDIGRTWVPSGTFDEKRKKVERLLTAALEKQSLLHQQSCTEAAIVFLVTGIEHYVSTFLNSRPAEQSFDAYQEEVQNKLGVAIDVSNPEALRRLFYARKAVVHNGSMATEKISRLQNGAFLVGEKLNFETSQVWEVMEIAEEFVMNIERARQLKATT
jgi:hypothetical protein